MHPSRDLMQKEIEFYPFHAFSHQIVFLDICSTKGGMFMKQIRNVKTVEWLM